MLSSQKRIVAAVLFAAGLVSVALFLRSDKPTAETKEVGAVAVVSTAPERKAIPEQDANNDGVPDWQDALQVTEALDLTGEPAENYTPPETLTEQFALDFFEDMVRAENYGEFGDSPEELVANAATALATAAEDKLFTKEDVTILNTNSATAFSNYGETVARIIVNTPETTDENEAVILERALRSQDPNDLAALDQKIAAYEYLLTETKKVPVPNVAANAHLGLLNSYQAILEDIKGMRGAFHDPMYTLLRMKRYQDDVTALATALANLYNILVERGATWEAGSAVYNVITINGQN